MYNADDIKFMQRSLQLAERGHRFVSPNPMVGAVIVCDGLIIGEGFHCEYGKAHAEVNAINSVVDKSLLGRSTIYVSLEPCSHYGKTPPCAQLIIDSGIPKVVIASLDPYPEVSGRGVKMLEDAGIEVVVGVLTNEAMTLNKAFFTSQLKKRPYIFLKWAQTKDGYIDKIRSEDEEPHSTPISTPFTQQLVHKLRSEVMAIMVGTNTALNDNPSLTTRLWYGKNPIRVVLDRTLKIPKHFHLYDGQVKTLIFTESVVELVTSDMVEYINVNFDDNLLISILGHLHQRQINSILVEGGRQLLQSFIDQNLWDEVVVEIANKEFGAGVEAPRIDRPVCFEENFATSKQMHYRQTSQEKEL